MFTEKITTNLVSNWFFKESCRATEVRSVLPKTKVKKTREIYKSLSKFPLTQSNANAFSFMIHFERGYIFLKK